MLSSSCRAAVAALALSALAAAPLRAAEERDVPAAGGEDAVVGERLTPEAFGPVLIEDLAAAVERFRTDPPRPRIDVSAPFGRAGEWWVPSDEAIGERHSGEIAVANKYGDVRMGIGFPGRAEVHEVWVAGQGGEGAWAEAVRAIGYRRGREIGRTAWLEGIGAEPIRLEIGLAGVDRIEFEARPGPTAGGWYLIDDLAFTPRRGARTVLDFEDLHHRAPLTGSNYRGLDWELGSGAIAPGAGIPAPVDPEIPADRMQPEGDEPLPANPAGGIATPPILEQDWEAVRRGDAGQFSFPPDTCGAIGPDHFVCVVNLNFAVFSKATGAELQNIPLSSFQPGSGGDPRVIYDHYEDRWIVISTNFNDRIFLAYSLTDNPLATWFKTSIVISQGSDASRWPDYPTLGYDENGIYVAASMIGSPGRMTILAIDKAPLLGSPAQLGTVTAFRNLDSVGAIQPCATYGDSGGCYTISAWASSSLRLRRIQPPLANPTLQSVGFVTVPFHTSPPDAPAQGSTVPLDTVGDRLMNAVWRDGFLWTAHAISVSGRSAVRWYRIDTTSLQDTNGTISDPVRHYFFPSICVNAAGDAVVGFSGSSASEYASCYVAGRAASDPAGEVSEAILYHAGTGAINNIDGFGRNRFGDYSLTTLDPEDESSFWTIQEYGRPGNNWSTRVGRTRYDNTAGPPNDLCADATIIGDGVFAFSTIAANTDGPDESVHCNYNGETQVRNDVWFRYVAPCDGLATADVCSSDFDNRMVVYGSSCPIDTGDGLLLCIDDFCGSDGKKATVFFQAEAGEEYLLRIGGTGNVEGSGTLQVVCVPDALPCDADIDGNGEVGFSDLVALLAAWGPCPGCPADIDGDDAVTFNDLVALLAAWGPCP